MLREFKNSSEKYLPSEIAAAVRENPAKFPEAATTSKRMAVACLTTGIASTSCLYHTFKDKRGLHVDGKTQGGYELHGTPGECPISRRCKDNITAKLSEGLLHCGCTEESALWDFLWAKTWSASEVVYGKRITEPLKDDFIKPRHQMFFLNMFKEYTGLEITDMYRGKHDETAHKVRIVKKQISFLMEQLNKLIEAEDPAKDGYIVSPPLYQLKYSK